MSDSTLIERAFELARSGSCRSVEEIRRTLLREHYANVEAHMSGLTIRRQLKALMVHEQNI